MAHKAQLESQISSALLSLGESEPDEDKLISLATATFATEWKRKADQSEQAFQGLLHVLELCLASYTEPDDFSLLLDTLGYHSLQFWQRAVPALYDSDMSRGTAYRDALLFGLALHDVNKGSNRLRELFAAVPGLRGRFLGHTAKRFGEAFTHIVRRRNRSSSKSAEETPRSLSPNKSEGPIFEDEVFAHDGNE